MEQKSEDDEGVRENILQESVSLEGKLPVIKGYDFNNGVNYSELINFMGSTGFQASNLADAINTVNHMLYSHEKVAEDCSEEEKNPTYKESVKCKIFLGFTSNLISSGLRNIILYLAQYHMVEVIVTEAGGIEKDLIKCLADTYRGDFKDWINPILDRMLEEQKTKNVSWTPSKVIARLGEEINDESSYLYWAYKNDIPVFCPGFTDGFLGKAIYDHFSRNPGLVIDIVQDIRAINGEAVHANTRKTGVIILGGLPRHHICNVNMMRNGADYAVFINTAKECDGSDSGARPDEAVSWRKIGSSAQSVKVHCDATIAFPLLVAKTFAAKREKPSKHVPDLVHSVLLKELETLEAKRKKAAEPRSDVIDNVSSVVLKESESLEDTCPNIKGYDNGVNYSELLKSMASTGFQASNLGYAIDTVNQMLDWRLSHEQVTQDCNEEEKNPAYRESVKCKIFLGFTSNLISSGVRDIIRYLVQHHMVDAIVTTAGGIEEDLIKCLADTYRGDFSLPGADLRFMGLNRTGNLLVPNGNYCKFEDWIMPIYDQLLEGQKTKNVLWTPSKVIARLGKEMGKNVNHESSYLYWAYKNNIPVFCPALTDGSLGDMIYLHLFRKSNEVGNHGYPKKKKYLHLFRNLGLVVDIVQDIGAIIGEAKHAKPRKTGVIILGGGLPKHHICNANLMRNGADYAVYINTAQEFDGSDSGASPDEAVSWGKIHGSAKPVKVNCDATIAFPLLVAETFAEKRKKPAEPSS